MRQAVVSASMFVVLACVPCALSAASPVANSDEHGPALARGQEDSKPGQAHGTERIISVDLLPAPVYAALMSLGTGIKILKIEEDIDGGVATYEIDLLLNDTYYEVELDAGGSMIGSEIEAWIVPLASVPEPAREAIEEEAVGAAILEVRMEIEEDIGEAVYEADIRRGRRAYALRIDARGTLIERDITMDMLPPGAYWALVRAARGAGSWSLTKSCTTASPPTRRTS